MIYILKCRAFSHGILEIERVDDDMSNLSLRIKQEYIKGKKDEAHIELSEQDLYDLIGVLTEQRKRILNSKTK
jgi:hypothetical protein